MVPSSSNYLRASSIVFAGACTFFLALTPGCSLFKKKSSGSGGGGSSELIVRTGIFFDRESDKSAAQMKFKTTKAAQCELAVYSQDPTIPPLKDSPKVVPCTNPAGGSTDFTEEIPDIRTDVLYFVQIRAWTNGSSKDKADTVLVKESQSPDSVIDPTNTANGNLSDVIVARFDIPLMSAEIHRHQLATPAAVADIRGKLARVTGCQTGVPNEAAPFRDAAKDIAIKNLTTMDFAAGTAGPQKDYPERQALTYGSLNDGMNQWTLTYILNGKDGRITARPIVRIQNMEMQSTEKAVFKTPQLVDADDALKVDVTKTLKFSWTTAGNLLDSSYMTVQIGRPDYAKAIYCIFPAEKGTGSIEASLLAGLDDGKQVVITELNTNQLFAKEGWIVTLSDWRSGRIEK